VCSCTRDPERYLEAFQPDRSGPEPVCRFCGEPWTDADSAEFVQRGIDRTCGGTVLDVDAEISREQRFETERKRLATSRRSIRK
jgi:hypothetical protein